MGSLLNWLYGSPRVRPSQEHIAEAIRQQDVTALENLLREGAIDPDARTDEGTTLLLTAIDCGAVEAVRVLLDHGADPNLAHQASADVEAEEEAQTPGETPLIAAVANGEYAIITLLLTRGARVTDTDADGRTALHHAAHFADVEAVRLLLASGASATVRDRQGDTPLWLAQQQMADDPTDPDTRRVLMLLSGQR